ncbi:hypothetical protein AOLI_G00074690 [Acnodon oligacanthus]
MWKRTLYVFHSFDSCWLVWYFEVTTVLLPSSPSDYHSIVDSENLSVCQVTPLTNHTPTSRFQSHLSLWLSLPLDLLFGYDPHLFI